MSDYKVTKISLQYLYVHLSHISTPSELYKCLEYFNLSVQQCAVLVLWLWLRGACRCIRPNDLKSPDKFQADKVLIQLRYTGILETTRIRKEVCVCVWVCVCVCVCVSLVFTLNFYNHIKLITPHLCSIEFAYCK